MESNSNDTVSPSPTTSPAISILPCPHTPSHSLHCLVCLNCTPCILFISKCNLYVHFSQSSCPFAANRPVTLSHQAAPDSTRQHQHSGSLQPNYESVPLSGTLITAVTHSSCPRGLTSFLLPFSRLSSCLFSPLSLSQPFCLLISCPLTVSLGQAPFLSPPCLPPASPDPHSGP